MTPLISNARVLAVDPKNRQLVVALPSQQVVSVRMAVHGPADGVRVSHAAMPGRFTEGIVVFPFGDNRNGVWLASIYAAQDDAYTTETDQFAEYNSHWSGYYDYLDGNGQSLVSFPDGTYLLVSGSTAKPSFYRHIVDDQQNRQLEQFTDSQRVPNPPSARHTYLHHASGTFVDIDPSGNLTVSGASGAQIELKTNNGYVLIDNSGVVTVNSASGKVNLSVGGASDQYTLVRTDLLVSWLSSHTHSNGNNGSPTGTPIQTITNSTIQSNVPEVSG